jgi:hypothetical protein
VEQPLLLEEAEDLGQVLSPEALAGAERQLEGRALDVVHQDLQVVGVDPALLHRLAEEVVRVLGDVLVEGGRVADEHRHRGPAAATRATGLLPGGGDASRVADQHRGVEAPDVDPQLERVGGDDAEYFSLAQPALDLASLEGQVSASVAADDALGPRLRLERLLQVGDEDLGGEARRGEHDRLQALREEGERNVAGRVEGRAPDPELSVHDRRVVDREVALAPRGPALVDEGHLALGQGLGQLLRVPDRGR